MLVGRDGTDQFDLPLRVFPTKVMNDLLWCELKRKTSYVKFATNFQRDATKKPSVLFVFMIKDKTNALMIKHQKKATIQFQFFVNNG